MQCFKSGLLVLTILLAEVTMASPEQVVESFHQALIAAMQAETDEKRSSIVDNAINSHFQIHTIARISLGRNWRTLQRHEQAEYMTLMEELISTTYASRFNKFDNQTFAVVSSKPITSDRKRVNSILNTKSEVVNLDYQLQFSEESWRIYDIVANGVSDLSLKRSNYAALFADGGLDAVSADIRTSINKNREEPSG